MSGKVCPVCGSENVHEYRMHGISHLRCSACCYDSGEQAARAREINKSLERQEREERERERNR